MNLPSRFQHYIDGHWVAGASHALSENPSDLDDPVGEFALADAAQLEQAVAAAAAARRGWAGSTPAQRFDALDLVGSELLARREELGRLLAREEGKTLPEGIGEVARAGQIFKFFAGEAMRVSGEKLASVRPGVEVEISREAVGVVGLITPWNFPFAIPAWKIAPALAYGNTVVFKPSELVPGCAWALAEILSRSGLPPGAFNLVLGSGAELGRQLVAHAGVDAISFTGSVATGHSVLAACAARQARVQLEMGGKNPLVVLADADLERAVECAIQGAFYSTGQRCTASSRLIVDRRIHDAFLERLQQRTEALVVGHALEAATQIGPVVSADQLRKDLHWIEVGRREGATLLCGGSTLERPTRGHYLRPALLATTPEMRVAREEIFGPVACVITAEDEDHALQLANDTPFGLAAGVCTQSLKSAARFRREAQAGMVMVNLPTAGVDPHVPFGGRKASSFGPREQGRYAAEFYTVVKTSYVFPG